MQFDGAVIKEPGVTFAVVMVKKSAMKTNLVANKNRAAIQRQIQY